MTFFRWTDPVQFREIAASLHIATRRFTNVYAIVSGDGTTLIDTGEQSFAEPLIRAQKALPPVRSILLTHSHYDHAGGAALVSQATGATVYAHPAVTDALRTGTWRHPYSASPTLHGRLLTRLVADRAPDGVLPVKGGPDLR